MKGIIFDLDGVICHTDRYHYEAWKKLADRLKLTFDEKLNHSLRGISRLESLNVILEANQAGDSFSEEEKHRLAEEKNKTYKELLAGLSQCDLQGEAVETLTKLKEMGIKLAIGSSSRNAGFILEKLALADYFTVVIDGNIISSSKPDPEVFLRAAKGLGLAPRDCFVVEDSASGIEAAASGEFESIAMGSAVNHEKATHQIKHLGEIMDLI